ncbi:hypothetical protein SLA2020_370710 [Shorea laevis]
MQQTLFCWRVTLGGLFYLFNSLVVGIPVHQHIASTLPVRNSLSPATAMTSQSQPQSSPPVAKKVEHVMEMFGDVRVDNYYWLRDDSRSNPEVISYLRQENGYTDAMMSGSKQFESELFTEMRGAN